jgi:hypothetical protein
MNLNAITTADGYFYTQQPSGWYTDGDIEFDYRNTDMRGVVWQFFNKFYCADGDGMVTVQPVGEHFVVAEQGDVVSVHHTLREALFAAQAILAADYSEVYENHVGE